ncbi:MAG: hypothetical protein P8P30_03455 [Rickettsiales bacterium]|nr:hypothetical protein [Rickettsiales bacterium]
MVYSAQHAVDEAAYQLSRGKRYAGGMAARLMLRLMTAAGAATAGMSGGAGVFYASGLLGVGTGIGLQAYLNQKDYEHNKEQLAGMYRKELSAVFQKDGHSVSVDDLENLATQNPSIKEQLDREKTKRNVSTGIWLAAGVFGFAAAAMVIASVAAPVGAAVVAVGAGTKIAAAITGLVSFQIARPIVKIAAEKHYKIDTPTTVELVKSLEWQRTKGKQLTHAQVLEAYIAANPQMGDLIQQNFGAPLAQLSPVDQQRVALQFGERIKLDEITTAINEDRMNARELVFAVHGKRSGAYADVSYKQQWDDGVAQVKEKARTVQNNMKRSGTRALNNVTQTGTKALNSVKQFVGSGQTDNVPEAAEVESTAWRDYESARKAGRDGPKQPGM